MANAKSRFADNQAYLSRVSAQTGMQFNVKSPGVADRLVRGFRAQEAKGLPLSRRAARGHRVTPEHGKPRASVNKLPAPAVLYGQKAPRSKYVSTTQRLRHRRPKVQRQVNFDRGVVYSLRTEEEVWDALAAWRDDDRMTLTGYDCSTRRWVTVFGNAKHGTGASIGYVRDLWLESGLTLEQFMVEWSQEEYRGATLTHVCLFQIHVYPRERAAQRELKRRQAPRRR